MAPFYIAGRPETSAAPLAVHHPYDGRPIGETAFATEDQVERATAAAQSVAKEVGARPADLDWAATRIATFSTTRPGRAASRCSGFSCTPTTTTPSPSGWSTRSRPSAPVTRTTRPPTSDR